MSCGWLNAFCERLCGFCGDPRRETSQCRRLIFLLCESAGEIAVVLEADRDSDGSKRPSQVHAGPCRMGDSCCDGTHCPAVETPPWVVLSTHSGSSRTP